MGEAPPAPLRLAAPLRAGPPRPAARRAPGPHLLPRGPEPGLQPAHPRQGCQGAKQECLSNNKEVLPPHRTLAGTSLFIGEQKCQSTLKAPKRKSCTERGGARGKGGGASVIVVSSGPEEPGRYRSSHFGETNFEEWNYFGRFFEPFEITNSLC